MGSRADRLVKREHRKARKAAENRERKPDAEIKRVSIMNADKILVSKTGTEYVYGASGCLERIQRFRDGKAIVGRKEIKGFMREIRKRARVAKRAR